MEIRKLTQREIEYLKKLLENHTYEAGSVIEFNQLFFPGIFAVIGENKEISIIQEPVKNIKYDTSEDGKIKMTYDTTYKCKVTNWRAKN
jgi:hypothetical protein